jgi:hypothetical protein
MNFMLVPDDRRQSLEEMIRLQNYFPRIQEGRFDFIGNVLQFDGVTKFGVKWRERVY